MMGENYSRLSAGDWYLDDSELRAMRKRSSKLLKTINSTSADEIHKRARVLRELLRDIGSTSDIFPHFNCSYGTHISLGAGVFVNWGANFMDNAAIEISDNVRIGPNANLMTAIHPADDHALRREGRERAEPISIGENSWLRASVTVCPGVSIGRNSVIGAGSVVTRNDGDHVFAAGSPARTLRALPFEDR